MRSHISSDFRRNIRPGNPRQKVYLKDSILIWNWRGEVTVGKYVDVSLEYAQRLSEQEKGNGPAINNGALVSSGSD